MNSLPHNVQINKKAIKSQKKGQIHTGVNKIHCVYRHTCAVTLSSFGPQTCRYAPTFISVNKALVQLQQKLILKVGVANAIKYLITINLGKQVASPETLFNKISLQK